MLKPVTQVSRVVSRVKGEPYTVDDRIGPAYLGSVLLERGLMRVRAVARLPGASFAFVGRGAKLRSRRSIHVGRGVSFGPNSYVDATSINGIHFGDNVAVGRNTRIECTGNLRSIGLGLTVGDNVGLGTDCFYGCAGGITIGSDTIVGNFASFHSENHTADRLDVPIRQQGVSRRGILIGRNCWIGAKATILDGAEIGDGCVIAAGAVVTAGKYPANGIYGGVPAKLLKSRRHVAHVGASPG